jgi:hypothetical protein
MRLRLLARVVAKAMLNTSVVTVRTFGISFVSNRAEDLGLFAELAWLCKLALVFGEHGLIVQWLVAKGAGNSVWVSVGDVHDSTVGSDYLLEAHKFHRDIRIRRDAEGAGEAAWDEAVV